MAVVIKNNKDGKTAEVTVNNQLLTRAESVSLQHFTSRFSEQAYQVWDTTTPASGTKTILHLKNDDADRNLVVTYIRAGFIVGAGTSPPNTGTYFEIACDRTASGGDTLTPVNLNRGSGKTASVTATGNGPTMAGTAAILDQGYPTANGTEMIWNKEGSVVLALNDTIEVRVTHDNASGLAYARISFLMLEDEE